MTHVTRRLTAKNRDQLRNPTLGNRVWATFTFFTRTRDVPVFPVLRFPFPRYQSARPSLAHAAAVAAAVVIYASVGRDADCMSVASFQPNIGGQTFHTQLLLRVRYCNA